jgi:hypothetical protein
VGKEDFGRRCKKALLRCVTMCYKGRMPIKYNGQSIASIFVTLRNQCSDLQAICQPYLQGRRVLASPSQARIDEVNAKLDVILAAMAKPVSPPQTHTLDAGQPVLSVIAGGGASLLVAAGGSVWRVL